jgi:DNA-binding response OmpR family regulator
MDARTVLVIEDDVSIREMLVELLDDAGYQVLQAHRGELGLSLAIEHRPSVVLVNQVLPDMSGLELLDALRQRDGTRTLPVILASGRMRGLAGRASDDACVLPMPFDIEILLTQVQRLALSASRAAA